ncbi:hypothetical protein BFU36_12635 [Sulfolobus sp. A20]|nr:hypothetical protein BFU36_12635 [Sulfolobus sp. A20]TRM75324.1 thiolase family protein [Sulfolobus sp. A20-N-F8]TRM76159.1 thiolase family protein [Sulfolobus sp. E5]TRM77283.1 thiolase family protein [Sulfolobus sp. B5]TRM81953.1 thiolase family protein [Sulfolobus sp. D5]TRM82788.1 thiolase family protein [Sulfolobus sp. A20-N-F6]TRM85477.1 thiolase family protein [Sulfolobus sp. F3]TRM89541.1 thiolase family protein [Sulfolobus sp. C3]TRM98175.1 thiolase family protein [Sulfolobus sp
MVDASIVGFGFYYEKKVEVPAVELFKRSIIEAIKMANMEKDEIDGLVVTAVPGTIDNSHDTGIFLINKVASKVGINKLNYFDYVYTGGSSIVVGTYRAFKAVESGLANNVLVVGGGKGNLLKRIRSSMFESTIKNYVNEGVTYYELTIPTIEFYPTSDYALIANRYMREHNTDDSGRAMIAVKQRENANLNPKAIYRGKLTLKDVLESPMVSYPLRLLEVTNPVDGALAILVSKNASKSSISPIKLMGFGEATLTIPLAERENILDTPVKHSVRRALNSLNLDKIDYYGIYDAYTIMVLLEIEGIGLADNGKGGEFVMGDSFLPTSSYPINTSGGSLNVGQVGFTSGGVVLAEALYQLAGLAENRQVKDARIALVNTLGGVFDHSATIVLGVE